jgi:hypothetical protein
LRERVAGSSELLKEVDCGIDQRRGMLEVSFDEEIVLGVGY